jgi:hypothetical protein
VTLGNSLRIHWKIPVSARSSSPSELSAVMLVSVPEGLRFAASTLCRLEIAEQSVTLGKLDNILKRLKAGTTDVFP